MSNEKTVPIQVGNRLEWTENGVRFHYESDASPNDPDFVPGAMNAYRARMDEVEQERKRGNY